MSSKIVKKQLRMLDSAREKRANSKKAAEEAQKNEGTPSDLADAKVQEPPAAEAPPSRGRRGAKLQAPPAPKGVKARLAERRIARDTKSRLQRNIQSLKKEVTVRGAIAREADKIADLLKPRGGQ
eukprot:Hpha_TRINITY_DN1723_c0_g1::TRINITY_DN1723_c0_g1_i1::g.158548::m.158548